jgi:hypothetical protein
MFNARLKLLTILVDRIKQVGYVSALPNHDYASKDGEALQLLEMQSELVGIANLIFRRK